MELVILLVVAAAIFIIALPLASFVKLSSIDSRLQEMEQALKELAKSGIRVESEPERIEEPDVQSDEEAILEIIDAELPDEDETPQDEFGEEPEAETPELQPACFDAAPQVRPEPASCSMTAAAEEPTISESPQASEGPEAPENPETAEIPETIPAPAEKPKKTFPAIRFENLLSKIGIVTLVLGIGFFVKYAIDKEWINEVGRVGIGVLTGGALIAIAHKLRKSYNLFSAIMVGGGISVLYITITLAFREYQLFSQTAAFVILIAITVFSVILSLVYDRRELALFSLLGGYASPLMISTGAGNYVVLFSFLVILNAGMLAISMRKKWRIIGIVSFVCTLAFYWTWLAWQFENQRTGALIFGALFFAQFYLLALFDHFRSEKKISPFQVGLILAGNLSMFAAAVFIFADSAVKVAGLLTISMAVVNAAVMLALFRKGSADKRLLYLIIALVLSFISLAVPVQLNGHVITMFWAAETVILLWLWQKSGIKVFYAGFWLISVLTLGAYIMDADHIYMQNPGYLPVVFNRMFITGLVVVAAFALNKFLLERTKGVRHTAEGDILSCCIVAMSYMAPFLEIKYQFGNSALSQFTYTMLTIYTTLYAAVLAFVFRARIRKTQWMYAALCLFVAAYLVIGLPVTISLRYSVFTNDNHPQLFALHYLTLPALAYVFYLLATGVKAYSKRTVALLGWAQVAAAVVILSFELSNIAVQNWGYYGNYYVILNEVRTSFYPILWGILALTLMVWGLKAKKALLRQIALGFFGLIILKFYVYDIWLMSQAGRILSFVALGVILLFVSFLIQKIKILIKEDEQTDTAE